MWCPRPRSVTTAARRSIERRGGAPLLAEGRSQGLEDAHRAKIIFARLARLPSDNVPRFCSIGVSIFDSKLREG
jgi:hypothetical protein